MLSTVPTDCKGGEEFLPTSDNFIPGTTLPTHLVHAVSIHFTHTVLILWWNPLSSGIDTVCG